VDFKLEFQHLSVVALGANFFTSDQPIASTEKNPSVFPLSKFGCFRGPSLQNCLKQRQIKTEKVDLCRSEKTKVNLKLTRSKERLAGNFGPQPSLKPSN